MNYRLDKNQFNHHSLAKLNVLQDHQDPKEFQVQLEILVMLEREVLQVASAPLENLEMRAELACQEKLEDQVFKEHLV